MPPTYPAPRGCPLLDTDPQLSRPRTAPSPAFALKVLSLPLGLQARAADDVYPLAKRVMRGYSGPGPSAGALTVPKATLLLSAASDWGPRPAILRCVSGAMGDALHVLSSRLGHKVTRRQYLLHLLTSAAVLCLPGLGYDSYRIYEALAAGAMPVLERAIGLDRSWHRLPVLQLDDFAEVTPAVVRQAYVEALYHAHQGRWDYRRLTERWWTDLVAATAAAGNLTTVLTRHPMPVYPDALGGPFSRPLVPFSCRPPRRCGRGTHRTPARSCAIDPTVDFKTYNWLWQQGKQWPWHQTTEEKAKSIRDSLTKAFAERRKKKVQKS